MSLGRYDPVKRATAIVLLCFVLAACLLCAGAASASRGGASGQDPLLAPGGYDTKASSADDVKQDGNQKCGSGGGGGGGAGGGGKWPYSFADSSFSSLQGAANGSSVPKHDGPQYAMQSDANKFSGSGESGTDNAPVFQGTSIYGSAAGNNYPNYSSRSSSPLVRQPMHPQRGATPDGHPRDATNAGLPPCCKDKLPCCSSHWPCCQKAEYHGFTQPGSPNNLPYSQNMQGKDNFYSGNNQGQNNQGQNNNNNNSNAQNNANNQSMSTPAMTEMSPSAGNTFSGMSSSMSSAMGNMMNQSGMSSSSGGKIMGASAAGVTSLMNTFNQIMAGQTPGANKEQQKTDVAMEKSQVADNLAEMERTQASTAIEFVLGYLKNFTAGGNQYTALHDEIFVPIAVLLLLPGAVLAQMRSIVAQGTAVLGEVNPWEGILRSIVAIFLIMSSGLVMNYGIDVVNSAVQAISQSYHDQFGADMGSDAAALHVRAHPVRLPQEDYATIPNMEAVMFNYFGNTPAARMEGELLAVKYEDPAAGLYIVPPDRAPETVPFKVPFAREAFNEINCGLAVGWVLLCAMQVCYLYYLYFVGPVMAAFWVYPSQMLRQAYPGWLEGVVSLCFWSFFWATTVCLMACFRGCDDTGTLLCTALLTLALIAAKNAFDFVGLAKEAGRDAGRVAEKVGKALLEAKHAAAKGKG